MILFLSVKKTKNDQQNFNHLWPDIPKMRPRTMRDLEPLSCALAGRGDKYSTETTWVQGECKMGKNQF